MAGKRRGKLQRLPSSQAGTRARGGRQSANIYSSLADAGEVENSDGELNGHLMERFPTTVCNDQYPDPENVPLSVPSRMNNDIWKYTQQAAKPVAGSGTWLEKPELPNVSEIFSEHPPGFADEFDQVIDIEEALRPNRVNGPYTSIEEYLGTQYDLLREDAIRPLREAVAEVRKDARRDELDFPHSSSVGIYEPVYVTSVVFSPRGLAVRVAFSLSRVKKLIRWRQSKRLISGTLVALSPYNDGFQTQCLLATVAARPLTGLESNPPEIDLFFARSEEIDIDPMKKYIMVEARSSFYEASRHTLLALQHLRREPFPLSAHIVHVDKKVEPPAYLQANPYTDMSSLISIEEAQTFQNVDILQEWPAGNSHGLDSSQSKALRRILTNRVAIIQGPPGTGKTYVSVAALKIMLANLRKEDPPIIVTCQTNHALDQMLRHVAEFEGRFIRLGGRSKDKDKIKKRTLFEVRQSVSQEKVPGSRKSEAMGRIRQLTKKMQMLLTPLELGRGPLNYTLLRKLNLITHEQAESLKVQSEFAMGKPGDAPGIHMEQWLGRHLVQCYRPYRPEDFGMVYEEEDFDEVEQLQEMEAEAIAQDDDDIEALKGPITLISDNYHGRPGTPFTDTQVRKILDATQDLNAVPVSGRGAIYNYLLRQVKRLIRDEFRKLAKEYEVAVSLRCIGQQEQDQALLLEQRLIGMTTTGLSKYRALISSLRPRIVLVEEAAETLEAPVTVACLPTLEHLILVGDHKQLRPHCHIRDLENEPYQFNLSLFERLVMNDIEMECLTCQRRMIPEIRRLLEPIYKNTLKDHATVTRSDNRPPVEGMGGCNSFFFTHEWNEERDANMSAFNDREANMIIGFFKYLVLNGVEPGKITVLTFYNGQRKRLLNKLRYDPDTRCESSSVVTVDSYQGEENDIVLLSLVRSNKMNNIGFLSVDNRVCVALSRAKRGFYIFGNAQMLATESDTWAHVVNIVYGKGKAKDIPTSGPKRRIGYHLPLKCVNHGNKTWIEDPEDWQLINGGCDQACRCQLPCGHTCMLKCHPFSNERIMCTQKCNKRMPICGHPCSAMCSDPCRCIVCERHNNGEKGLLKARPATGAPVWKATPQNELYNYTSRPQAAPFTPPVQSSSGSAQALDEWEKYKNGGAKEDDARIMQQKQKEDAEFRAIMESGVDARGPAFARLIDVSPKKRAPRPELASSNMQLLVDVSVDAEPPPASRLQYSEIFSYLPVTTGSKKTRKAKESMPPNNLLD